jgi:hypothetical protein
MNRFNSVLVVALASIAQPAFATQALMVNVSVSCEQPTTLQVTVRNDSPTRAKFDEFLLPWNYSKVLRTEAYQVVDGKSKRLPGIAPIADYLRKVSLAPKQLAKGKILLSRSFAGFDDANKSGDILIFYRVNDNKLSSDVRFDGDTGVILIPKKGLFSQGCPTLIRPSQ